MRSLVGWLVGSSFPGLLTIQPHTHTHTHIYRWTDFNALARTSRAWLAATRDDVIWRPVVEGVWGWTQHPPARAAWMKQEQEQQGMWVRLFRRLARSAFCLEPGGYRARWQEDYVISIDIRDTAKVRQRNYNVVGMAMEGALAAS